jgi:hypothetical protein
MVKNKSKEYKHVYCIYPNGDAIWRTTFSPAYFITEREAAIDADKELIKRGKKPVNILKSKNQSGK